MYNVPGRLVIYLVAGAAIFVILFGIRASASIINPILLATVVTITVLPIPGRFKERGLPGWLSLVKNLTDCCDLATSHRDELLLSHKAVH
jgi:predicted PurR-regulated permease PerM